MICTFCFQPPDNPKVWCVDNPGHGCTYGMHHEFPEEIKEIPQPPVKKTDKKLCTQCGLHPKNPLAASNGCQHVFGS